MLATALPSVPWRRRALATALLCVLAACGTGGARTDPIFLGVIGPEGGTATTGRVTLTVVPGALPAPVGVRIFPQAGPLPLDPADGDVEILELHCISPLGQGLLLPCTVRYCYDPAIVPPGADVADLVLLEWSHANGWLVVRGSAAHDTTSHCFTDTFYGELGNIGIGLRTANYVFLFQGTGLGSMGGNGSASLLHVATTNGSLPPLAIPGTTDAYGYVPSGDGRRVLFALADNQTESSWLRAVSVPDGNVLFESSETLDVLTGEPLYGWFPGQPTNLYYAHRQYGKGFIDVFADADLGGAAHVNLRNGGLDRSLIDIRVSPDGTRAMLRYDDYNEGGQVLDVVSTSTGALIGGDLPVLPASYFSPMPRWLPDSSGITFVDPYESSQVYRINPDGTGLAVLYVAPSAVVDAVVSPDGQGLAYLRFEFDGGGQIVGQGANGTTYGLVFGTDALAGGSRQEQPLGGDWNVSELAYHPDGRTVWCELSAYFRVIDGPSGLQGGLIDPPLNVFSFVAVFDDATALTNRVIGASLGQLDIDRVSGDVLLWVISGDDDPQFPSTGIWHLADDGTGGTPLDLGALTPQGPPRFLTSWRNAVCSAYAPFVR